MKWVYKIVSALCALAILPLTIFSPMIYYYISSVALQGIFALAQMMGSQALQNAMERNELTSIPEGIADTLSLYEIGELYTRFSDGGSSDFAEKISFIMPALYCVIAALIMIIICAIVTVVFAIVCKDNRKVIASSFAGIGLSLLFKMLFENLVNPFLTGQINMSDFIEAFWASLIAEIEELTLTGTFYFIPGLFAFIALWTILYNATLPEKEKAARMKMIG